MDSNFHNSHVKERSAKLKQNPRVVILMPVASNLDVGKLQKLCDRARTSLQGLPVKLHFLFSVNPIEADGRSRPKDEIEAYSRSHLEDTSVYVAPGAGGAITDAGAGRHVNGFFEAAKLGDYVIDMDSAGAHNPDVISQFAKSLLGGKKAVLSTRFFMKGAGDLYPLQRRIASLLVTFMANLLLGLGMFVPDMASGYQGFDSRTLLEIYKLMPPEKWVTMKTTTVFIETELRSYVLWYLKWTGQSLHKNVAVLPIVYGAEKKGAVFPTAIAPKVLKGFLFLFKRRGEYKQMVKR